VQSLEIGIGDCRIDYGDAAGVAAGLLDGVQRHEVFSERRRETDRRDHDVPACADPLLQ
jgi:hypothetical protein